MDNNVILRRLRYCFDFSDQEMIDLFASGGKEVTRAEVSDFLKKEEDEEFQKINDKMLATYLNGLINVKRGKRDGPQPVPEKTLTNNLIFRKLRIALNLKDDDILYMLQSVNMPISKHELSAFFRKPGQRQYRLCKDQILRNFLFGMERRFRKPPSE